MGIKIDALEKDIANTRSECKDFFTEIKNSIGCLRDEIHSNYTKSEENVSDLVKKLHTVELAQSASGAKSETIWAIVGKSLPMAITTGSLLISILIYIKK